MWTGLRTLFLALQYDAVTSLLVRGAEWAASGKVTIPLMDKARDFESVPDAHR